MGIESLSPEQMEKAKACASPEELQAFLEKEGIKLSEEEIKGIAGGRFCSTLGLDNPTPCNMVLI